MCTYNFVKEDGYDLLYISHQDIQYPQRMNIETIFARRLAAWRASQCHRKAYFARILRAYHILSANSRRPEEFLVTIECETDGQKLGEQNDSASQS